MVLASASALMTRDRFEPPDHRLFVEAGGAIFSGHLSPVFATPVVQSGPLQLMVVAGIHDLSSTLRLSEGAVLALVVYVAVAGVMATLSSQLARWMLPRPQSSVVPGLLAGVAALFATTGVAYSSGHAGDVLIPLGWVAAAIAAQRGRWLVAGAALAAAGSWETWGVLGLSVLVLTPSSRRCAYAGITAAAGWILAYCPFLLSGPIRSGQQHWNVDPHSLLHIFVGSQQVGWGWRVVQGAAALSAGLVVGWVARGSAAGSWAVPVAVVAARLLTDPILREYYWAGLIAILIVAAAPLVCSRRTAVAGLPLAMSAYGLIWGFLLDSSALVYLATVLAAAAATVIGSRKSSPYSGIPRCDTPRTTAPAVTLAGAAL